MKLFYINFGSALVLKDSIVSLLILNHCPKPKSFDDLAVLKTSFSNRIVPSKFLLGDDSSGSINTSLVLLFSMFVLVPFEIDFTQ